MLAPRNGMLTNSIILQWAWLTKEAGLLQLKCILASYLGGGEQKSSNQAKVILEIKALGKEASVKLKCVLNNHEIYILQKNFWYTILRLVARCPGISVYCNLCNLSS